MNSSIGYRHGLITPYRHVYTQDFEFPFGIPAKDRSKIRSIESLDKYVNDPALSEKLRSIENDIEIKQSSTQHVPCDVSRSINMNNFSQPLSTDENAAISQLSCFSSKDRDLSCDNNAGTITAEVIENPNPNDDLDGHENPEISKNRGDYLETDNSTMQTDSKVDSLKRKYGDVDSSTPEKHSSLSQSDTRKKSYTPTNFSLEKISNISPVSPPNEYSSKNVIDLTKNHASESSSSSSDPVTESQVNDINNQKSRQRRDHPHYDIQKVLQYDYVTRCIDNAPGESFCFIQAKFDENICIQASQKIMQMNKKYLIGDEYYYDYSARVQNRFWEIDLITNFSVFQTLMSKRKDFCFLENRPRNYGGNKAVPDDYDVPDKFSTKSLFATMVYRSGHFATLSLNTSMMEVCIYDGLFDELDEKVVMWKYHIESFIHLVTGHKFHHFRYKKVHGTKLDTLPFVRNDGNNCGPIACITIWYLSSTDNVRQNFASSVGLKTLDSMDLRKIITEKLKSMIAFLWKDMHTFSRYKTFKATVPSNTDNNVTGEIEKLSSGACEVCDICFEALASSESCYKAVSI